MYCSSLAKRTLIAAYSLLFTFQFPFTSYSFDRFTMEVFRHEIASSTLNAAMLNMEDNPQVAGSSPVGSSS